MIPPEVLRKCQAIHGWMDDKELGWLYDRAAEMRSVVEVGCWKGRSSYALLSGCKGPVYCIDHFLGNPSERDDLHKEAAGGKVRDEFLKNCAGFDNVRILETESARAATGFGVYLGLPDMVFIDGEHTPEAVESDIFAWRTKAQKLLCGHDRDLKGNHFGLGVPEGLRRSGLQFKEGPGSIWYAEIG